MWILCISCVSKFYLAVAHLRTYSGERVCTRTANVFIFVFDFHTCYLAIKMATGKW